MASADAWKNTEKTYNTSFIHSFILNHSLYYDFWENADEITI